MSQSPSNQQPAQPFKTQHEHEQVRNEARARYGGASGEWHDDGYKARVEATKKADPKFFGKF